MFRLWIKLLIIYLLLSCNSTDKKTGKSDTANYNATQITSEKKEIQPKMEIVGTWSANSDSDPKKEDIRFEFKQNGTMDFYFDELKSSFTYSVPTDKSKISVFETSGREEPIKIIHWGDDELKTSMEGFGFHGNVTLRRVK